MPSFRRRTVPIDVHVTGVSLGIARWSAVDGNENVVDLVPTYVFHTSVDGSTSDIEELALDPAAIDFADPIGVPVPQPGKLTPEPAPAPDSRAPASGATKATGLLRRIVANVTRRRDDDPDGDVRLPLGVTPATNGEYVPDPPSQHDRDVARAALAHADDAARKAGMDRRRFLQTAGGVAAVLATIDLAACSSPATRAAPPSSSTARTTTSRPGGSYTVPPTHEVVACEQALGGNGQFVVDVHTHHVMPDGPWTKNAPATVQLVLGMVPACGAANQLECASRAAYLHDLFLTSDTTVAMLSDVPNSGPDDAPVPFADQLGTQQLAAQLTHGGAPRVLVHNVIAPNFGDLNARLDEMEATPRTPARSPRSRSTPLGARTVRASRSTTPPSGSR